MKDYFGRDLVVGDEVAFITYGGGEFTEGVVVSFTPKQVRIEFKHRWKSNTPDYTLKQPEKVVKKNP